MLSAVVGGKVLEVLHLAPMLRNADRAEYQCSLCSARSLMFIRVLARQILKVSLYAAQYVGMLYKSEDLRLSGFLVC